MPFYNLISTPISARFTMISSDEQIKNEIAFLQRCIIEKLAEESDGNSEV